MAGSNLCIESCFLLLDVILLNCKAVKFTDDYVNTKLLEIPS